VAAAFPLHRTLRDLAGEKVREVLHCAWWRLFPTTWRLWVRSTTKGAKKALRLGIKHFEMSSGLNDSPKFVFALGQLVLEALGETVHSCHFCVHGTARADCGQRRWWRLTKKPGLG